jgi:hypothetical protein
MHLTAIGVEKKLEYYDLAKKSVPTLRLIPDGQEQASIRFA